MTNTAEIYLQIKWLNVAIQCHRPKITPNADNSVEETSAHPC